MLEKPGLDSLLRTSAAPGPTSEIYFRTDDLQADLKKRTIHGGVNTTAAQAAKFLLNLGSIAIFARLLVPADFGLIAMVTALTGALGVFTQLGLSTATIQRSSITHHQVSSLFWVNVAVGFLASAVTACLGPALAWFYDESRVTAVTVTLSIGFIINSAGAQHFALLNRRMEFGRIALIEIASLAIGTGAGIAAAMFGAGYWSLIVQQLAMTVAATVGAWLACPWRPGTSADSRSIQSMLTFGANLTGYNLLNYFARNFDNVLIGRLLGPQSLGLYSRAYNVFLLPITQINAPIAAVAVPALSRLADQPDRFRTAYRGILANVCLLAMPISSFMISAADWIVLVVLGRQWLDAAAIFCWLGVTGLIAPVANTTGWLFITQDRTRDQLSWGVAASILTILSFIVGLPWGAVGVAASYSLSGLLIRAPILFWWVGRHGPIRASDFYSTAAPCLTASVVSLFLVAALRSLTQLPPVAGLFIAGAITVCTTIVVTASIPSGRGQLVNSLNAVRSLFKKSA